jgi:hypothetical protein
VEEKLSLLAETANAKTKNLHVPSQTNDTDPPKVDPLENEDSWSDDDEDWSDDEQENNNQSESGTVGNRQRAERNSQFSWTPVCTHKWEEIFNEFLQEHPKPTNCHFNKLSTICLEKSDYITVFPMLPSMLRKYTRGGPIDSQDTVMPLEEMHGSYYDLLVEEMHGSYYDLLAELTYTKEAEKGVAIVFQQQEIAQQMPENCPEIDFMDLGELTIEEMLMDLQVDGDIADNIAQHNFVQPVAAIPIDGECATGTGVATA